MKPIMDVLTVTYRWKQYKICGFRVTRELYESVYEVAP
jgi:hypothetical protein